MINFLVKGLLRDKSRSMFPVMTVAAGVFLSVFLYSFMAGVFSDMLDANAKFETGHVKVMTRAYRELSDQVPNDLALLGVADLTAQLQEYDSGMLWTPRIKFGGLLDIPDKTGETLEQGPVMGIGINLRDPESPEHEILNLEKSIVSGRMPEQPNEILISELFAEKLNVAAGDSATLLSSTMYGSMAMYNFKVVGIIRFGMLALDKSTIVADINDVRLALDMTDGASEILGFSGDMVYAEKPMRKLSTSFNGKFADESDEFSPVMMAMSENMGLGDYMALAQSFIGIIIFIFVFAMSIVLWNSGLLNSLRRYGEIGVRLAMGEHKGALYRRMIMESVVIGIIGTLIGTALGLAASYYFQYVGWDISDMMKSSSVMITNIMRARVTAVSYYIGFIPGIVASVLGTAFAGLGIYRRQTASLFKELEV